MPYIKKERREDFREYFPWRNPRGVYGDSPTNPGDLNYIITTILRQYIRNKSISYSSINEAIGVLECAKMELYRRIAVPYEEGKMEENGDVYS